MYPWLKPRGYKHFDAPIGEPFAAKACLPEFVARHHWSPLIACSRVVKRYRPTERRVELKARPIAYASHRDSCIMARYAHDLSDRLDREYEVRGIAHAVLAYRKLGKSNYHFALTAKEFAAKTPGCIVHCFDVIGFSDNLSHAYLRLQLKKLLGCSDLPPDWFSVFKAVTKSRKVELADLKAHTVFGPRLRAKRHRIIGTIKEVSESRINIAMHPHSHGVPQGTPISAALSNLYMIDLDQVMLNASEACGALYQRYSDDIIIICKSADEDDLVQTLDTQLKLLKLEPNPSKHERVVMGTATTELFQYLGFEMDAENAYIRSSSLARQWSKGRKAIRRASRVGGDAIAAGKAPKVYTKKLRKRFGALPVRNFSRYARRAALVFRSRKILRQVRRFEKAMDKAIHDLN